MERLYTCEELAERYSVKLITIWDWIRKKKLPAIKTGREYRVRESDIAEFERQRMTTNH
jgi:excisionase family DNA binding protein